MEKILVPVSSEVRLQHLDMFANGFEKIENIQNKNISLATVLIGATIIALVVALHFKRISEEASGKTELSIVH